MAVATWPIARYHMSKNEKYLRWEFYKDLKGEYRWRTFDWSDNKLFASCPGYKTLPETHTAAARAGWRSNNLDQQTIYIRYEKEPKESLIQRLTEAFR